LVKANEDPTEAQLTSTWKALLPSMLPLRSSPEFDGEALGWLALRRRPFPPGLESNFRVIKHLRVWATADEGVREVEPLDWKRILLGSVEALSLRDYLLTAPQHCLDASPRTESHIRARLVPSLKPVTKNGPPDAGWRMDWDFSNAPPWLGPAIRKCFSGYPFESRYGAPSELRKLPTGPVQVDLFIAPGA
jgi:hypothetical protein